MAKILTDGEMLDVIRKTIKGNEIDDQDQYTKFLDSLANVIADHFGGTVGKTRYAPIEKDYFTAFHINECVPDDGGIFKDYDTDVTWKDGKEI